MSRRRALVWACGLAAVVALRVLWPAPAGVIVQGLIVGALTALVAFGLSLVYGANRIVNFAQADIGAVPAVLMVTLVTAKGWSYWTALPVALVLAMLTGAVIERFVIRPFADAPRLILTVATIGLAQILAGFGTALPFLLGDPALGQTLPAPFDLDFTFERVVFHGTDVMVMTAVPVTIAALVVFLRRSPWGIAIRGVAESRDRASLLGINVPRTQTVVWVTTAVLAAVAMILRAGVYGLPVGSAFGPSILLRALAAAVIGRMEDYRRMYLAASAFGVVEASIIWNENSAILIDPAIFVILLVFLLVQRRDRESRVADQAVSSWRSAGAVREVPAELARLPEVRWVRRVLLGVLLLAAISAPAILSDARVNLAAALFVFCIIAVSLVVLTGWGGEISLGQMAFVAIGAATAAVINVELRWDMSVTMLVAGLVGAVAAVIIGLPALRIRGLFLAVMTLAFALATSSYLLNRDYFSFLPDNTTERVERLPLFGRTDVRSEQAFYYVCLGALLLILWAVRGLERSRMRRVLIASRDNERNAQTFGVDLTRIRLTAFAISGFLAAFAGALFTFQQQALGRQVFEPAQSLRVLTMAVIGGLGSIPGALIGAVFLKSTEWFNTIVSPEYRFLFSFAGSGVGLLVVLRFLPGGLSRPLYAMRDRWLRAVARRHDLDLPTFGGHEHPEGADHETRPSALRDAGARVAARARRTAASLAPRRKATMPAARSGSGADVVVAGLDVHYGPVQVLFGVDVEIAPGSIVALLGTNGAGKSTLLRAISGLTPPTTGTIAVDGTDITGHPPHVIAIDGVVQVPGGRGIFPSLTVQENLTLATWSMRGDRAAARAAVDDVLDLFPALRERFRSPAATLSGGQQQMLTLGMAFIVKPRLLMIDELSLGLAPLVVEQLLGVVREINAAGTTVVLVEQSVNVALTVAETAYFMEKGEIRFSGPTADLLARPDVLRSVYLEGVAPRRRPARARARHSGDVVLEIEGVSKSFAGLRVIDDVDLTLRRGEILGIIGPNGAGKTTVLDIISGFLTPDAGSIVLDGVDVRRLRADERATLGLARSFQDARLFGDLTVLDTIRVALDQRLAIKDPVAAAIGLADVVDAEADLTRQANELVERFGLGEFRDKLVSELSTGSRRIVDIACQRALGAPILLFDEPSSGIAQREAEALGPVLLDLRDDLDASLIVIEHDMPLLSSVADRFVALDLGRVVCDGAPSEVLADPRVVASYLGDSPEIIERSGQIQYADAGRKARAGARR